MEAKVQKAYIYIHIKNREENIASYIAATYNYIYSSLAG